MFDSDWSVLLMVVFPQIL